MDSAASAYGYTEGAERPSRHRQRPAPMPELRRCRAVSLPLWAAIFTAIPLWLAVVSTTPLCGFSTSIASRCARSALLPLFRFLPRDLSLDAHDLQRLGYYVEQHPFSGSTACSVAQLGDTADPACGWHRVNVMHGTPPAGEPTTKDRSALGGRAASA